MIDYYVISHNSKFLSDSGKYKQLNKPVILPKCRFNDTELKEFDGIELIDYGIEISKGKFAVNGSYVTVPFDLTTAYILGVLLESEVKNITVAGFDGYQKNDIRQQEMVELVNLYDAHDNSQPVVAITPTSYPISKGSVYAPSI